MFRLRAWTTRFYDVESMLVTFSSVDELGDKLGERIQALFDDQLEPNNDTVDHVEVLDIHVDLSRVCAIVTYRYRTPRFNAIIDFFAFGILHAVHEAHSLSVHRSFPVVL